MSEIKSTLDLVLEKTRHLSLNEEEKRAVSREEAGKRGRGYVQKYLDGVWKFSQLERAVKEDEEPDFVFEEVIISLVDRIRPGMKETRLVHDLKHWAPSEAQPLLDRMLEELASAAKHEALLENETSNRILADLKQKGIFGSAIVPKIQNDSRWKQAHAALLKESTRVLNLLKKSLQEAFAGVRITDSRS